MFLGGVYKLDGYSMAPLQCDLLFFKSFLINYSFPSFKTWDHCLAKGACIQFQGNKSIPKIVTIYVITWACLWLE